MIPGQKTELHALEPEHLDAANDWINEHDITRFLTLHQPVPRGATRAWYESMLNNKNDYAFAIYTKRKKHIGTIGLHNIDWKNRNAMLGISIGAPNSRSLGYGEDAIRTLLRFAFNELNLHRVALHVYAFNARAIRCYEKCGFKNEGAMREFIFREGAFHDALNMGILKKEFLKMEKAT